ncbi:uncharacterized protein LTR77_003138 [Saxophila tyrrhenica]|uniref:Uncharacterized protein n=1 Tax=Saxophila tyrrhenica TaxID=1690608 RepID=A0AAV9PGJ5_9PEZI|nr:hypothetical protein LTR77_003138 [Saxophila tyrrhenica]
MSDTTTMAAPSNLTENDRKLLVNAWNCFKTTPSVDNTRLQTMGNYKTPASATACYLAARKKMLNADGAKMIDNDRKLIVMAWQCFRAPP